MGGIFNSFGAMSGQFAAKQERGQVAKALVAELQVPGKLEAVLREISSNSPGVVQQWTAGQTAPVPAIDLQKTLGKDNLLEALSRRTNMPPGIVKSSVSILLPLVVQHLATTQQITPGGTISAESSIDGEALLQALS